MTKKQFLLKQTEEQRAHLEEMARDAKMSMTAFDQSLQDEAWAKYRARKAYATAEAQVTKAPHIDIYFGPMSESNTPAPTPCACDGNCAGCGKGAA